LKNFPVPATRTALLIAFHYPPCAVSSGLQRTLSFSIHLHRHNWRPIVLSVAPFAYPRVGSGQMQDIPADVLVARTPALDATRHLAPGGRYWRRMAIPDAWASWWLTAVPRGLQLIARHQVDAIWSTYPIATAHRIGATLAGLTDRPWVADFRDPMVEHFPETGETFPKDPALRNARLKIEALTAQRAAGAVFCTDSARLIFAERHGAFPRENLDVIPNGYEEGMFDAAVRKPRAGPRVLLHSGTIYPGMDRDPSQLFCALGRLAARGMISPQDFELRLRDPGNVDHFRKLAADHGVEALVSFAGPLPYREALALQEGLFQHGHEQHLLLLEHPHVFTHGPRADLAHNLKVEPASVGADLVSVKRGGDVTYHGPGQLVGYPIVTVDNALGASDHVCTIQRVLVATLRDLGLADVGCLDEYPGVWVDPDGPNPRKIAAIGVRLANRRTMHGFALNVRTDLAYYRRINPCGLDPDLTTSLEQVLDPCPSWDEAADALARLDRGDGVLVEGLVRFTRELAAMVARSTTGEELVYPVVETRQRDHICHEVLAPAGGDADVVARAAGVASDAARAADVVVRIARAAAAAEEEASVRARDQRMSAEPADLAMAGDVRRRAHDVDEQPARIARRDQRRVAIDVRVAVPAASAARRRRERVGVRDERRVERPGGERHVGRDGHGAGAAPGPDGGGRVRAAAAARGGYREDPLPGRPSSR